MKHKPGNAPYLGEYYRSCSCGWLGRSVGNVLYGNENATQDDRIDYLLHVAEALQTEIEEIRYRTDASRLGFR